jgi:hypothetical protein
MSPTIIFYKKKKKEKKRKKRERETKKEKSFHKNKSHTLQHHKNIAPTRIPPYLVYTEGTKIFG